MPLDFIGSLFVFLFVHLLRLGGNMMNLRSTLLPGLEILGDGDEMRYAGLWEGGGWRAWCTVDWDAWSSGSVRKARRRA